MTTKAEAEMAFCTRAFREKRSCALVPATHVQARLRKGTVYAYNMLDDHAAKHMLYFLKEGITEFTSKHPTDAQQAGSTAVRENFVFREMTDFAVFNNNKIVRML